MELEVHDHDEGNEEVDREYASQVAEKHLIDTAPWWMADTKKDGLKEC